MYGPLVRFYPITTLFCRPKTAQCLGRISASPAAFSAAQKLRSALAEVALLGRLFCRPKTAQCFGRSGTFRRPKSALCIGRISAFLAFSAVQKLRSALAEVALFCRPKPAQCLGSNSASPAAFSAAQKLRCALAEYGESKNHRNAQAPKEAKKHKRRAD